MAEEVNLDTIDRGELLARVRRGADKATAELEQREEVFRRLDEERSRLVGEALLSDTIPDTSAIDGELATVAAQIASLKSVLVIAGRRQADEQHAEEAHAKRETFNAIKTLLNRRLEVAALLDKHAKAYAAAEREMRNICAEVWTRMGLHRDASFITTSNVNPERVVAEARKVMRQSGAPWALPEAGRYSSVPPSAATTTAETNRALLEILKPRLAPIAETNNA